MAFSQSRQLICVCSNGGHRMDKALRLTLHRRKFGKNYGPLKLLLGACSFFGEWFVTPSRLERDCGIGEFAVRFGVLGVVELRNRLSTFSQSAGGADNIGSFHLLV